MLVTVLNTAFTDVDDLIKGASGIHLSLLAAGWTLLEEIDADDTEQDRVYKSTGEDGTEAIYLRVSHDGPNDRIHFRAYSWWDATVGTGYNGVGDVAGNTCLQGDDAGMTVWMTLNKDALAIVAEDSGGVYRRFFGGRMTRQEPGQRSGRTTLVGPASGYNSQGDAQLLVASGTDFSSFEVDQYIWLVNQHASGPAVTERVQILGLDAPNLTIFLTAALTYDFQSGALVGTDPQPVVLWGDTTGYLNDVYAVALHGANTYESTQLTPYVGYIGLLNGAVPLTDPILMTELPATQYFPGTCPRLKETASGLADEDDLVDGTTTYVHFAESSGPGKALLTS